VYLLHALNPRRCLIVAICILMMMTMSAWGQQTSATLTGTVKDAQGAVIPGATVTLINQAQGAVVRKLTTEADGSFVITPLQPGSYTINIEANGFKKYEQKDIRLFANDRTALPNLVLEIGAVTETVTVEAAAVQLQTESAERSGLVTGVQTVSLALNGRNYLDLLKTVPGVVSDFNGQVAGPGIGNININGQRNDQNNITLDGVSNMDTGSNNTQHTSLNIDAIAEFKMLTNNLPAEFGRSSGGAVNVVTKAGTSNFHGTGYWFHRHEGLNAQTWRNNADGVTDKKKYRYNYAGFNVGGPVYIPGKFNTNKDKLFFFVAHEWQEQLVPNSNRNVTVPTEAERRGDFSLTHEANGAPVVIKDPLNGGAPFPNNYIPSARWNSDGAKILNWYPLPNAVSASHPDYNYQTQISASYPRRQLIARGDWNITENWRAYVRYIRDTDNQIMPYGQWNASYNIPKGPMHFGQPGRSMIVNLTTIVNPTLTNEFIFGDSKNNLDITPVDDAWSRAKLGLSYQMPFPKADPLGLVQNWTYGGVPNGPNSSFNGTPFLNMNNSFDITDNMIKVMGVHQIKWGVFIQRSRKDQTAFTPANGNIDFGRNAANPLDTNWAFSNALTGTYNTLRQSNIIRNGLYRYTNVEWYVADVWKVRPNLTLDFGVRFYYIQPQFDAALQTSSFNGADWDPQGVASLYQPAINPATGAKVAQNPITGAYYPWALVGALVPGTGATISGAYTNGMRQAGVNGYPRGLIDSRGVHYAPRLGIAWQVANKTVIRTGGGIFYDRFQGNPVFDMLPNPPSTLTPNLYYGTLDTIASTQGVLFPAAVRGFSKDGMVPTTYQWNFGIQRELPFDALLDVAYVGSASKHNLMRQELNRPGFGSAWQPYSQDPTVTPKFDGSTNKKLDLYRPYQGMGSIVITTFGASSNYHSLQVGLTRRLAQGLQAGVAYTWSKAMGTASFDQGDNGDPQVHPLGLGNNYGPLWYDRRQVLVFNYVYDTPKLAKGGNFLDNPVGRGIFNNWTVSGITTIQTGAPLTITPGIQGLGGSDFNRQWTGDETLGPRIVLVKDPTLPSSKRNQQQWFDVTAFAMPVKPSYGNESAVRGYVYGPGRNNWDVSIFKQFPFTSDAQRFIQIRLEMFNAPNHTQFTSVNTGASFNRTTGALVNAAGPSNRYGFGALTGTSDPRIIQLAAKIYF